jgi:DNA ligase-1
MANEPALLLAKKWEGQSLIGWHLSEKLDGVRALWDGTKFVTRLGNVYNAPKWFVLDFPVERLDGELWMGRGRFSELVGAVKRHEPIDAQWEQIRYLVFDVPSVPNAPFEQRVEIYESIAAKSKYIEAVPQVLCESDEQLLTYMDSVIAGGGEGLMAREPRSLYVGKRSATLLKIKRMQDDEATIYGYQAGEGKHTGRMGALLCRFPDSDTCKCGHNITRHEHDGTLNPECFDCTCKYPDLRGAEFKIGTGFSDAQRENPPAIGTLVTVRYQELSKDGVPRFPAFVGARDYE